MRFRFIIAIGIMLLHVNEISAQNAREGILNLKLKEEHRIDDSSQLLNEPRVVEALANIEDISINKKFPNQRPIAADRSIFNSPLKTDLSLIYELRFDPDIPVFKVVQSLQNTELFEYVEPAFINELLFEPSDAEIGRQWHHAAINSFAAWEIDTGSADQVVAIVDTGCDWDHVDLADALYININDPIDGIDNDGNGFIDDYRGWNFYDDTSDVDELSWSHGTHVAGLSGASTNNGVGVAGSGFASKVLIVKAGDKNIPFGYEGVVYAMEMGAQVINCSWGSREYTALGEDVMNAAVERGISVVCAAGNNDNEQEFFPASFRSVISVAATKQGDLKAESSTFNYGVDISAPGERVISTKNDDEYGEDSGTSMASPIVAGAIALMLNRYGNLNPRQVKAQLRETARNIDTIQGNQPYRRRLGGGILDMRAMLDTLVSTAIGIENYVFTDDDDDAFAVNDMVELGIELENYLGQCGVIRVGIEPTDSFITVFQAVKHFSPLSEGARTNNFGYPFLFRVNEGTPYNAKTHLKATITSGSYSRIEFIPVNLNPDFVNITVNEVYTTVGSEGTFGYTDFSRNNGLGFELIKEAPLLYEAGLMIGLKEPNGRIRVVDRVRGNGTSDRDFNWTDVIARVDPRGRETFRAVGVFEDSSAVSNQIGLRVVQTARAYSDNGHRNYVILEYDLINTSGKELSNLYVGIFADWDIVSASNNLAQTVLGKRMGMVSVEQEFDLTGAIVQLNQDLPFYSYSIDNAEEEKQVRLFDQGFSDEEKFYSLSNNNFTEGSADQTIDASHVVSAGQLDIRNGDTISVAFAIIGAVSKDLAIEFADSALLRYNGNLPGDLIFTAIQNLKAYPNPAKDFLNLGFELKNGGEARIDVYDALGRLIQSQAPSYYYPGANKTSLNLVELKPGSYFLRLELEDNQRTIPIQIIDN